MQKMYTPVRVGAIFIVLAIFLTLYVYALYHVQIFQPRQFGEDGAPPRHTTRTTTLVAARGNIYDRNSVLLASGRPSYNIKLDWRLLRGTAEANNVILDLILATLDAGMTYNDTFPVTRGAPFEFLTMSNVQRNRLDAYF